MTDVAYNFYIDAAHREIARGENNRSEGKDGANGGRSWFEALAEALGDMLGQRANSMMQAKEAMQANYDADAKGGQQSEAYMTAMTDFQVHSQLFGMESQVASTSIKAIGEGLTSVSRKQ